MARIAVKVQCRTRLVYRCSDTVPQSLCSSLQRYSVALALFIAVQRNIAHARFHRCADTVSHSFGSMWYRHSVSFGSSLCRHSVTLAQFIATQAQYRRARFIAAKTKCHTRSADLSKDTVSVDRGKGTVSHLLGSWLCSHNVSTSLLFLTG
jgi:hypothetical protein